MKKILGTTITLVAMLTFVGTAVGYAAPSFSPPPPECPSGTTCTIDAKAIDSHEIDTTEWHFVINQTTDAQAPGSITVSWSNGTTTTVFLDKVTGGVAHYTTTDHLGDGVVVTGAQTSIDGLWDGQFNLSHGPGDGNECEGEECEPPECEGENCNPDPCVLNPDAAECQPEPPSFCDLNPNAKICTQQQRTTWCKQVAGYLGIGRKWRGKLNTEAWERYRNNPKHRWCLMDP